MPLSEGDDGPQLVTFAGEPMDEGAAARHRLFSVFPRTAGIRRAGISNSSQTETGPGSEKR